MKRRKSISGDNELLKRVRKLNLCFLAKCDDGLQRMKCLGGKLKLND